MLIAGSVNSEQPQRDDRFWAIGIVLVLLDAFKLFSFFSFGQAQPWVDAPGYWNFGGDVAAGDIWLWNSQMSYRTPGYLWTLGFIRWIAGSWSLMSVIAAQLIFSWATSVIVGWSAARLTKNRYWGLLAYAGCACGVNRAAYATSLLTETFSCGLFTVTVILLLFAIISDDQQKSMFGGSMPWVFAMISLVLGILFRPAGLSLALPAAIALLMLPKRSLRSWIFYGCATVVISVIILGPWCERNRQLTGRFTLCTFTGRQLWTATYSPWPGAGLTVPSEGAGGQLRQRIEKPGIPLQMEWNWVISSQLAGSGLTDAETDAVMYRVAVQGINKHKWRAVACGVARCITFWKCWEWPTNWHEDAPNTELHFKYQQHWSQPWFSRFGQQILELSPGRNRWGTYLVNGVFGLSLMTLLSTAKTRKSGIILGSAFIGTTLLTAAAEIPVYRYRMVLEPLMVLSCVLAVGCRKDIQNESRYIDGAVPRI